MRDKITYEDMKKRLDNRTEYSEGKIREYDEKYIKPFTEKLLEEIEKTKAHGWKIKGIFDYDCDGIMAGEIMSIICPEIDIHIGDRYTDGYGIVKDLSFLEKGDMVVLGDIGSTEVDAVKEIYSRTGRYPFIIDHHEMTDSRMYNYPKLLNFCNPVYKIPADEKPDWCTSGLMFQILFDTEPTQENLYRGALYNMCGTVADVVKVNNPFDTNRDDLKFAMNIMNYEKNLRKVDPGLAYFFYKLGIDKEKHITTGSLNFKVNPVINALGRIGTIYDYGVTGGQFIYDTLNPNRDITNPERETRINECISVNEKRKMMEKQVYESEAFKDYVGSFNGKVAVMYIPDLHRGICGRVAQELVTELNVPAICLCGEDAIIGSCRTPAGYPSLLDKLGEAKERGKIESLAFGGHAEACGLRLQKKDIKDFIKNLSLGYASVTAEKQDIPVSDLSTFTIQKFLTLEPYGVDFPLPYVEETVNLEEKNISQYTGGWTSVQTDNVKFFGKGKDITEGKVTFRGTLGVNSYAGKESLMVSFGNDYTVEKTKEAEKEPEEEPER